MKPKKTTTETPKKLTLTETRAALDAACQRRDHAREKHEAAKVDGLSRDGRSAELQLADAEAHVELHRAEIELHEATIAHRDALLEAELESGDPEATAAANWTPNLAAKAHEIAELRAKVKRVEGEFRLLAESSPFAALMEKRHAAREVPPLAPPPRVAPLLIMTAEAELAGKALDHQLVSAVRGELYGSVDPGELGATNEERVAAMFSGRASDVSRRTNMADTLKRLEMVAAQCRRDVYELHQKAEEAEKRRQVARDNFTEREREQKEFDQKLLRKHAEQEARIVERQAAADAHVAELRQTEALAASRSTTS